MMAIWQLKHCLHNIDLVAPVEIEAFDYQQAVEDFAEQLWHSNKGFQVKDEIEVFYRESEIDDWSKATVKVINEPRFEVI
jgi:hypothetical protein